MAAVVWRCTCSSTYGGTPRLHGTQQCANHAARVGLDEDFEEDEQFEDESDDKVVESTGLHAVEAFDPEVDVSNCSDELSDADE